MKSTRSTSITVRLLPVGSSYQRTTPFPANSRSGWLGWSPRDGNLADGADVIEDMWQLPASSGRRRPVADLGLLMTVAAAGVVLLHESRGGAAGYRVEMRPAAPLSPAACRAEAHALQMAFARDPCHPPATRPWFRIVVRNVHDGNGYPVCTATALDARGHPLFRRDVPIGLVGGEPSGPPVERGTTLRLIWFFDPAASDPTYTRDAPWTSAAIRAYTATCHGRPDSQVPV